MYRLRQVLLVTSSLGLLAGCGAAHSPRAAPPGASPALAAAADSVSAHGAAEGFLAAFDSLQWEEFRSYLADDMTMFFPFPQLPSRVDGRQAVENVFREFMESQRTRRAQAGQPMVQGLPVRDLRVQMAGPDVAIVSFHLGSETPSRRSVVFHRDTAGAWKVVHWHASPAPRPSGG
ncbi:MAG TPA: nuclear transport factor 2 family protein [Longimicrobium sp.]|nr:nuclear transport factor 2 family protein [Longimicrobium sp.]